MKSSWKIILLLIAIVLVSATAGVLLGARLAQRAAHRRSNPEDWNVQATRTLQHRLRLSPEQLTQVQGVMDGGVVELKAIRIETLAKTNTVVDRLLAEVDAVLTPEQRAEFAKLKKERRAPTIEMLNVEPRKR